MQTPRFAEKFIAFVDVLGFENLVDAAENDIGKSLPELLALLELLGNGKERAKFEKFGPTCCPAARMLARNLDFRVTQVSDCVVVSAEISPAGLINLVSHCWGAVIELLSRGIMCRGYIKRGSIYHTDTQFIGTGYQSAFDEEGKVSVFRREAEKRGTPYVAVDPDVVSYVAATNDKRVVEMFNRMVKQVGREAALFPFKMLRHSFIIPFDGSFNAEEERQANQNTRASINNLKALISAHIDRSNESAVEKARHYIDALDAQLEACNRLDARIEIHSKWL